MISRYSWYQFRLKIPPQQYPKQKLSVLFVGVLGGKCHAQFSMLFATESYNEASMLISPTADLVKHINHNIL